MDYIEINESELDEVLAGNILDKPIKTQDKVYNDLMRK